MLKKLFLILLVPLFFCGCSKDLREEITFASWGSATEVKVLKQIINDFEAENPKIRVNFMHVPQNYFQKMHLLFASNTPPDVLFINNLYLPAYSKYLEDLSNKVNSSDFYPQTIQGMSVNGKIYAVPRDVSSLVFYINLDKTNLPDQNWTLNDLLNICKNIGDKKAFCLSYEDTVYWLKPYLSYFGGGIIDGSSNLIIDSEKSKKGISFYKDLKNKYHYAPMKSEVGSSTPVQMFLQGKIVLYLSGRWMYPKISEKADFNWAVINFPYGESPQEVDMSGWAISKNTKHKDASVKFVQYLSGVKSSEYFTQTGLVTPARIDTAKLLNNKTHNEKVFIDIVDKSETSTVCKDYWKLTDKLNNKLDL